MSSINVKNTSSSLKRPRKISKKQLYSQFESLSTEDLAIDFAVETASPIAPIIPNIRSIQPYSDYISTRENYVLFYIRFTSVEYGFFTDLISIHTPVKEVTERYSAFFENLSAYDSLEILAGPKIGVETERSCSEYSLSHKKNKKRGSEKDKLFANSTFAEQNITSSHLLIISPPSDAKFNRDRLRSYQDNKSEETLFVERWLPAVQGSVPLSEDAACVLAASLHTLNSKQSPSVKSTPRDFIHRAVPLSKLSGTKIDKVLEDIKLESVASIQKLCVDTILSNYLSAAIVFSVAHNEGHKKDAYLVMSRDSVSLVNKSNLTRITPNTKVRDIKGWVPERNTLRVEYVSRVDPAKSLYFQIRSNDTFLISDTLTAVGYAFVSNK